MLSFLPYFSPVICVTTCMQRKCKKEEICIEEDTWSENQALVIIILLLLKLNLSKNWVCNSAFTFGSLFVKFDGLVYYLLWVNISVTPVFHKN